MLNGEKIINNIYNLFYYGVNIKKLYHQNLGYDLNLLFPKALSEKIQYLKLFDSTKEKADFTDKIKAKELFCKYIISGSHYIKPTLGKWNNFDEINFDQLPKSFVLKLNTGSGFNSFIVDKDKLLNSKEQISRLKHRTETFIKSEFWKKSFELHYKYIKPLIFAEEIIGGVKAKLFSDWMIYCFNGRALFAEQKINFRNNTSFSYVFDKDFKKLDFSICAPTSDYEIEKPHNYYKMFEFAEILSNNFKFVRVDFIEYDSKLYFGEMTFTPYSGFLWFNNYYSGITPESKEYDIKLGKLLKL